MSAVPPSPPPSSMSKAKAFVLGSAAIVAAVAGISATTTGAVQSVFDWTQSASRTQSQLTAITERTTILEGEKAKNDKDRAELTRIGRELLDVAEDLRRIGTDVSRLSDSQRDVDVRVARLDALVEMLRERKGTRR